MTMIAIVTAAALRPATVPISSARIAATASSAAVPATSRTSVSVLAASMKLPPWRSDRIPTASSTAASSSPNVTRPVTTALASSTCPRCVASPSVVLIRPRRYSALLYISSTTTSTTSPTNVPSSAN